MRSIVHGWLVVVWWWRDELWPEPATTRSYPVSEGLWPCRTRQIQVAPVLRLKVWVYIAVAVHILLRWRWALFRISLLLVQDELKPEDLVGPRLLKKKKPKEVSCVHSCDNDLHVWAIDDPLPIKDLATWSLVASVVTPCRLLVRFLRHMLPCWVWMLPMPSSSTSETGKLCRISVSPTLLSKLAETRKRSVPDKKKKKRDCGAIQATWQLLWVDK